MSRKLKTMYELPHFTIRLGEGEIARGRNMFFHETIILVPRDNLKAIAKLKKGFPALTLWDFEMLWPGSGWRMRLGNLRLILHMLWSRFWGEQIKMRIWGRWIYRKGEGMEHQTYWFYDDTQRVCRVGCSCGKVFARRKPTWLYPRIKVRV